MKLKLFRDFFVIVLIVLGVSYYNSMGLPEKIALPLSGSDLNDEVIGLSDYRGKTLLVHFWGTWCPICTLEGGVIESISNDYAVLSVAISSGDGDAIRHHMTEHGLTFSTIVDETGHLAESWGVSGVPATFILNDEGVIQHATTGYSTELGLRFWLWWYSR